MGKNYDCLFNLKYQNLIWRIVTATRQASSTIPEIRDSKNGCVRVTLVPLSQLADDWLGGGLSNFGQHPEDGIRDVCEREFVYKLHPEGSHTVRYVCQDGHTEPVNCYSFSALKVAHASWKRQFDAWVEEHEMPDDLVSAEYLRQTEYMTAENGYSFEDGTVCLTIRLDGEDFLRLYVTVSGAQESINDERCAFAGTSEAQEYFSEAMNGVMVDGASLEFQAVLAYPLETRGK